MSADANQQHPLRRRDGFISGMPNRMLLALFPFSLLIFAHCVTLYRHGGMVFKGNLLGPDAYMRLVRVSEWFNNGSWYEQLSLRSNAPFGEILHWSRPLDVALVIGAFVGSAFTDFDTALFWWGSFLNPVLHILALLLLLWAAEPLFPPAGRVYLGLLAMVQFALTAQFSIGRPDHHGFIAAVFIALIAIILRLVCEPESRRDRSQRRLSITAGLLIAFAIWVSVEGLFSAAILFAALGLLWICVGGNFAHKLFLVSLAATLGLSAALLIEYRPSDLFTPIYDAFSIVHLLLFFLLTLFWGAISFAKPIATWPNRLGIAVFGAICAIMVVWLIYPKFFSGPMVDVHPRIVQEWFHNNQEVMPLFGKVPLYVAFQNFFGHLGATIPAFIFAIILVWRTKAEERRRWAFLLGGLILCTAMAFYERRWTANAQMFLLFPYVALLLTIMDQFRNMQLLKRAFFRSLTMVLFAVVPLYLAGITKTVAGRPEVSHQNCDIRGISEFLKNRYNGQSKTIMTYIFLGPEFIFRSNHKVIPSPYHRNTDGMLDFYDFFRAVNLAQSKKIAEKRNVDLVILCQKYIEAASMRVAKGKRNLYQDLIKGEAPNWLQRIRVPKDLEDNFILYETKF